MLDKYLYSRNITTQNNYFQRNILFSLVKQLEEINKKVLTLLLLKADFDITFFLKK